MDYIHITLQKYTFSLKQQTIGADFLESDQDFSKNENAKMQKCCQQIQYDIFDCVNSQEKLYALMYGIRFINDFYRTH